jgi:hypothetical protein
MPRRRRLNAKRWWLFNDLVPGTRQPAMARQRRCPSRRRVSPAGAPPGSPAFCKMAADGSPVASFNADQRRRADHNVGHPLRAETLLDAEPISRYGAPPLDTAERPWTVPLPDFDNRPLAAGTLAPLPTGRVNKAQLLFVLVDVNDIETSDPPRRPAVCRHLRGPGRKALAALVLSGVALVIFGRLTQLTVTTFRNVIGGMDLEARSPPASRSTPNCAGSWTRPPGSGASGSTGSN